MIDRLFEKIANVITRRPVLIAVLIAFIVCVGLYGMTHLTMQTGWKTYLDKDSAKGILYNKYSTTFQSDALVLIVKSGNPVSPEVLSYVDRLEGDIRQQRNIQSVTGIVDILKAYNKGTLPQSQAEIDRIMDQIPASIKAKAVPSNIFSLVQIQVSEGLSDADKTATLNTIEATLKASGPPPDIMVDITGTTPFVDQMSDELTQSMVVLIAAAMILMVLMMGLLFSYVSHRFLPVLIVGIGLVISMGLMGLAGISLNLAVVGAFPVLIGLGIDYAIQFHARFDEEARKGSLEDAVFVTVTRTGPAVLYAMLATCMGFFAMFISPVPMIRSFGLVSIIGVMSCYCISLFGIPTAGLLFKYKPKPAQTTTCYAVGTDACSSLSKTPSRGSVRPAKEPWSYGRFLTDVSVKIAKNPVPVLLIAALLAVIGFQVDAYIPVQTNENTFVPPDMPAKVQRDLVTRVIGSTDTRPIIVEGERVTDLDTLSWIRQYEDYELAHHDQITSATSIADYIVAYNGGVMPETQSQANHALGLIPNDIKEQYLDGSMVTVIQFGTRQMEMQQRATLKEAMIKDAEFIQPPPGITAKPTGDFDLYTSLMTDLSSSKENMTLLGFVLIFAFLALVYRHLHAVTPLVPIIIVIGWNAVAMYLLDLQYTPLTVTLGSMTIGIAAEYTILVMERYTEEYERVGDTHRAIQESVKKIGTAITVSGLATFFGFSALLLASFPIISNFGITTLIAVGFSLAGAIFIMPAVLSLMGTLTDRRKNRSAASGTQEPEDSQSPS